MIRAVLLDKDGTLTDFRATWEVWLGEAVLALAESSDTPVARVAEAFGYDLERRRIAPDAAFVTSPDTVTAAGVAARIGWEQGRVVRWLAARAEHVPQVPVRGAAAAVERLVAMGMAVGILTNARRAEAVRHLGMMGVMPHLVRVIGCDCGFGAKPDHRGAADFADALGLARRDVLLVGDGLPDMGAARGAGLRAVGVLTGTLDAAALTKAGAEAVLPDVAQLPDWLLDHAGAAPI